MRGRGVSSSIPSSAPRPSPAATVANLQRRGGSGAPTLRSTQVKADVDALMDDFYAQPSPSGAPIRSNAVPPASTHTGSSAFCKPLSTIAVNPNVASWERGPKAAEGRMYDASDRNILCMDVRGPLAVVGCADHGLKVVDITNCREKRNLFNKKFGHTEWVTSCAFTDSGKILSGGMDSKLCLWHESALRCDDLLGHTGSVSQVDVCGPLGVSSAYDRTIRIWDLNRKQCSATLAGHAQPVTQFAWCGPMILSGDRKGTVKVWDVESGTALHSFDTKRGQVGCLGHAISDDLGQLSFVGDQGGVLTVFDFRRMGATPIREMTLHPGGVVSDVKPMVSLGLIVTAGADKKIHCLDPKKNFEPVLSFTDHKDFIYSLHVIGDIVLSGAGNGWLLAHSASTGKCLYGLGANAAAVRAIHATPQYLVAAGDDGKLAVYDY